MIRSLFRWFFVLAFLVPTFSEAGFTEDRQAEIDEALRALPARIQPLTDQNDRFTLYSRLLGIKNFFGDLKDSAREEALLDWAESFTEGKASIYSKDFFHAVNDLLDEDLNTPILPAALDFMKAKNLTLHTATGMLKALRPGVEEKGANGSLEFRLGILAQFQRLPTDRLADLDYKTLAPMYAKIFRGAPQKALEETFTKVLELLNTSIYPRVNCGFIEEVHFNSSNYWDNRKKREALGLKPGDELSSIVGPGGVWRLFSALGTYVTTIMKPDKSLDLSQQLRVYQDYFGGYEHRAVPDAVLLCSGPGMPRTEVVYVERKGQLIVAPVPKS